MALDAVEFGLADGSVLVVPLADLGRVYDALWGLADRRGAISTAALLVNEGRKQSGLRYRVELTPMQSDVLTEVVAGLSGS